jgi:MFS family permease
MTTATTTATTTQKRSIYYLLGMCTFIFGANFVWVSYNSILLLPMVEKVVAPEVASLTVGIIGFFSTIVGFTVSILSGIITDHTTSRWGRRTPAILISSLIGLPFIAAAAFFKLSLPVIAISYLGMQFFTNVGNGAWWPLLVDTIPEHQRGLASGLQGLNTLIAAALGFGVVTYMNEINRPDLGLITIAVVFAISGVINALTIRPYDKPAANVEKISLVKAFKGMFSVKTRVGVFFWMVLAAFLLYMGQNSLQYFARDFIRIYLNQENPDAGLRIMGMISLVITMAAAVGTGALSDKIGRRKLILWGAYVSALTSVLMVFSQNFVFFLVLTGIRSIATGPIVAVIPALAGGLSPKGEAGQYMAYNNLSTGVSGAVASLLFGALLNIAGAATVNSYINLLIVTAAFYVAGAIVFQIKVPQKELDKHINPAAL